MYKLHTNHNWLQIKKIQHQNEKGGYCTIKVYAERFPHSPFVFHFLSPYLTSDSVLCSHVQLYRYYHPTHPRSNICAEREVCEQNLDLKTNNVAVVLWTIVSSLFPGVRVLNDAELACKTCIEMYCQQVSMCFAKLDILLLLSVSFPLNCVV